MRTFSIYQADAFTDRPFRGNPAAVVPLDQWLPDALMQQIAMENNLAETAFVVPYQEAYQIRWFTPSVEVDLCGHATLASAHIFYEQLGYQGKQIRFWSRSGWLSVTREDDGRLTLDFPADPPAPVTEIPTHLFSGLGIPEREVWRGKFDYLVELGSAAEVKALQPDFRTLAAVPSRGVLVTAKGDDMDFVSRCFFPQSGIDEDPVTGSAHCLLAMYWHERTGKTLMQAFQASARGGMMECEVMGNRILMRGKAVTFLKGEIYCDGE